MTTALSLWPPALWVWDKKVKLRGGTRKENIDIKRPAVVKRYNQAMGGVDKLDQLLSLYRMEIKSRKMAAVHDMNSWLEYRRDKANRGIPAQYTPDVLHFHMSIAEALTHKGKPRDIRKRGRPFLSSPTPSPGPASKRRSESN